KNLSMFRSNDIRTPSARLTDALAMRLARAEACYFRGSVGCPGVVVAHDARASGPRMLEIAVRGYTDAGLDCIVLPGVTGVCQFYYAAMRHPDLAGVFIGASHNPAGDTGRKMLAPGLEPIAEGLGPDCGLLRIAELYKAGESVRGETKGRVLGFDATPGYIAYSLRHAQVEPGSLRRLRILHDYLHAAGGRELMLGFRPTDAQLRPLHFTANPALPLGDPNPVKQDVIAEGLAELRAGEFDLGMFFDGDADRMDVYLGDGTLLASSFVYAAILPLILRRLRSPRYADLSPIPTLIPQSSSRTGPRKPDGEPLPTVYVDTKSSPLAAHEMAAIGAEVGLIRSGHSHIKHTMNRNGAAIGTVEESAHFYEAFTCEGARYCTENTLYFALMVAKAWTEDPGRFGYMAELQAGTGREREWGHVFPSDPAREDALSAVREHFAAQGAEVVTTMADGTPMEADLLRMPANGVGDPACEWLQISQRASQSEDRLARWEVLAGRQATATEAKHVIQAILGRFGAGPEYRG
ncbi:MAG: phosphoglucomutase, partial [Armatimonadetes bacterium]|nr:phosphoglucomutase [Armatimonadota bacterium]